MESINVATNDFRAGLLAAKVHASTDKDDAEFHRIRLSIVGENLAITATDRYTVGLSLVSVWDSSGELCNLELLPAEVDHILGIFKGGKDVGDDPQYRLRLDITPDHLTVTDCSGFIDGHSLRVPRLPSCDALSSVPGMIQRTQDSRIVRLEDMTVNGEWLSRFRVAATVYRTQLIIESHDWGRALLVRAGESFLGMMMPFTVDEDEKVKAKEWAEAWTRRLPGIAAAAATVQVVQ